MAPSSRSRSWRWSMFARATQLEIDTTRIDIEEAVELFRKGVLPALHELEGFEGVYVLANPDGKALIVSFWATEPAADIQVDTGFYGEQLQQHAAIFRAPPGRASYSVVLAEQPVGVGS
jgi:heme-degrading monooxygenase HmoA